MAGPWDDDPPQETRAEAFGPGLGRAIRVIRAGLDMSRKDLSEKTRLSRSYIAEIENGRKTPSSRALAALAAALGVDPRGLLEAADRWEHEPPPHSYDSLREATTPFEVRTSLDSASSRAALPPPPQSSRLRSASSRRQLLRNRWRGEREETRDAPDETLTEASAPASEPDAAAATPGGDSDALSDASQVLELFARLGPEDRERVIDMARRLAED
jgi:transcriptional regulator with XRE-family HTH domain